MNLIPTACKFLITLALAVLAVGCVSGNTLIDRENVAVAAGFKVITPTKPAQLARLRQLPADTVTRVMVAGKPFYILPALQNNQAYVGGPKQYQVYLRDRRIQKLNSENAGSPPATVQVVEVNEMDWAGWDGWDGLDEPDWY
ncbi:MAG TPA: hypothetical protein VNN22_13525 [Verrucomicrobiae bacterium]|nr:hypothetical protein [Verrucomicrobiae bacterium]